MDRSGIKNEANIKRDIYYLLITGGILGALFFVIIYGVKILDFTYDGWLVNPEIDLGQHYVSWCNYRNSAWRFPIGLNDRLTFPFPMSVIYTDSIPLFAVIFKILSPILPVHFQYFGLFGIVSYMLSSALAAVLLRRFISNKNLALLASPLLSVSFPILQRMYYHTALASHWIIFLALILWVYDVGSKKRVKRMVVWALMGVLCVSIHSYFLPMIGMILLAYMICEAANRGLFVKKSDAGQSVNKRRIIVESLLPVVSFCIGAILNLWILGGFYGGGNAYGPGLGTFGCNLNTFINPIHYGAILPELPLYYDFQYEGFAYLGAGVIMLLILCIIWIAAAKIMKSKVSFVHENKVITKVTIGLFVVSMAFATLPLISIGDKKIVWIPYIAPVERLLGIFRSNGRLVWVAMYILIILAVALMCHIFNCDKVICSIILAVVLCVQAYDLKNIVADVHEYCTADHIYEPVIVNRDTKELLEGKTHFVFLYNDNDITINTAFYGYLHNMYQNNFYYARDIDELIDTEVAMNVAKLNMRQPDPDAVYVIQNEGYENNKEWFKSKNYRVARVDENHLIFVAAPAKKQK